MATFYTPPLSPREPALVPAWYGVARVPTDDLEFVANHLGGTVVDLHVSPLMSVDQINAQLDQIHAAGYRAIVNIYDRDTCSKRPWEWNGSEWVLPQYALDILRGIAHHPGLFAVYALHEPFDSGNVCHWTVAQHQELYQLLQAHTAGAAVWSDIGSLSIHESHDVELTDGICDYCGAFHHRFRSDWTSERCLEETLSWIEADLDTQRRLMPNSQVVFLVQTCSLDDYQFPLRLPTVEELEIVRDRLCILGQPLMYYPWVHGSYDLTLKDAPQLWPVVTSGCRHLLPDISGSSKAVSQGRARPGETLAYTLTVTNAGKMDAAFLVTDVLGNGITFAGTVGPVPGNYEQTGETLTWSGTVSPTSQAQLSFRAVVAPSGTLVLAPGLIDPVTNTAYFDDRAGNVYAATATTAIIAPQLRVMPDVHPTGSVLAGAALTFTIVLSNAGSDVASVVLSDG